jgi:hypothetical protein
VGRPLLSHPAATRRPGEGCSLGKDAHTMYPSGTSTWSAWATGLESHANSGSPGQDSISIKEVSLVPCASASAAVMGTYSIRLWSGNVWTWYSTFCRCSAATWTRTLPAGSPVDSNLGEVLWLWGPGQRRHAPLSPRIRTRGTSIPIHGRGGHGSDRSRAAPSGVSRPSGTYPCEYRE